MDHHTCGGVAHLGERLNGIQEVVGSIPIISTTCGKELDHKVQVLFFFQIFKKILNIQQICC